MEMNAVYSTQLQTSQETISALSRAIYNRYGTSTKWALLLSSFFLATVGLMLGLQKRLGLILVAIACLLLSQFHYPAVYRARRVSEMFGSQLPQIRYDFYPDRFTMSIGEKTQSYSYDILIDLYQEKDYLYLFPDRKSAFMVCASNLRPAAPERFRADLSAWSGLSWTKAKPFLLQSFPVLLRKKS